MQRPRNPENSRSGKLLSLRSIRVGNAPRQPSRRGELLPSSAIMSLPADGDAEDDWAEIGRPQRQS
jgi:hypothetical protein